MAGDMKTKLFQIICFLVGVGSFGAFAQDYPTRPVRLVVPFAPGGGTDIAARVLADGLTQSLRQTFVVDNRGGAGSVIGTEIVAKSAPDGYTLLLGNISLAFNSALYSKLPYDALSDLAPISLVVDQPNIVVAHPSLPAQTLKDFVALARASPGKYTYASAGVGSGTHLATELLAMELKLKLIHVPYKGTGPALTALLGNEISVFVSTFASALPHVKAARLRSFAVTSAQRVSALPEVPTVAESGVPGYDYSTWYGLLGRAGTPRAIVESLNKATVAVLETAEVRQRYASQGMEAIPSTAEAFSSKLKAETEKWTRVIRATGARAD
jgi:tripartite-type tricarboxylate transporter receptor subunit TctC